MRLVDRDLDCADPIKRRKNGFGNGTGRPLQQVIIVVLNAAMALATTSE